MTTSMAAKRQLKKPFRVDSAIHLKPKGDSTRTFGVMHLLLQLVGLAFGLISLVCWLIIVIDAFKSSIWQGALCFVCFLYFLYYALVEFEHENKIFIVLGAIFGGGVAGAISRLG